MEISSSAARSSCSSLVPHASIRLVATIIGRLLVVAFVGWHATAVTVSSLPDRSSWEWVHSVRGEVLQYTDPYMYWLSLWQNWGMFSQGSVSRVVLHNMERYDPDTYSWVIAKRLGFHDISGWDNDLETGLLRTIEEGRMWPVRQRYLWFTCGELGLPEGTWVRMSYPYFDMPIHDPPKPPEWWATWEPTWEEWPDSQWTQCPPLPA